ncbi:hypothetical protein HN51_064858 [Arachis hypogaea]
MQWEYKLDHSDSSMFDHGVMTVGYSTNKIGTGYSTNKIGTDWIVKNPGNTEWDERGYIKMKRGIYIGLGLCGIAMNAFYYNVR